jgi:hypothetical protein
MRRRALQFVAFGKASLHLRQGLTTNTSQIAPLHCSESR